MGLYCTVKPTQPVITLPEIKAHLKRTTNAEDNLLEWYERAVVNTYQKLTDLQLAVATWKLTLDRFPPRSVIYIPKPPVISITSIKYQPATDTGTLATWTESGNYTLDNSQQVARIIAIESYPSVSSKYKPAVEITFKAGSAEVDADLQWSIAQLTAQAYMMREPVLTGTILSQVPFGFQMLCELHKVNYSGDWNV